MVIPQKTLELVVFPLHCSDKENLSESTSDLAALSLDTKHQRSPLNYSFQPIWQIEFSKFFEASSLFAVFFLLSVVYTVIRGSRRLDLSVFPIESTDNAMLQVLAFKVLAKDDQVL